MHRDDPQLRAQWLALCADPTRDDLAAAIAAAFRRELDDALAELTATTADDLRAGAIARALRAVLGLQLTRERAPLRPGPYLLDLRRRLDGAPADERDDDPDDDPVPPAPDRPDPFLPWTLGDRAREAAGSERAGLIDAAIAAFDAIARRPIDPGNDLGPFTRIAELMDESQVRRSLAVAARMDGAGWGMELDYARAYLFDRLAELGHVDEAESSLPAIADRSIHAFARGRVFGHRVAHGHEWTLPADLSGEPQLAFICGLTQALPAPPESLVLACLDLAHPPMEVLLLWCTVGPLDAWSAALRDHCSDDVRIGALLDLAAARPGEPGVPAIVRAALDRMTTAADHHRWIDQLLAVRPHVSHPDVLAVFTAWMTDVARNPRSWSIRDLYYTSGFTDLLRWLAGDAALAAAARRLDELTTLLADVPSAS